jgi:hypothetical protein
MRVWYAAFSRHHQPEPQILNPKTKLCSKLELKRLSGETNLDLNRKGISLKERLALKKYLEELRKAVSAVEQVNSTAFLCPMLISLGA